ncbi:Crp/Fnr family transcriptional regulator [bacterium]|nr:Crp/Fnr family transcriptional regulator [bacterium]
MPDLPDPKIHLHEQNHLLAALPAEIQARLFASLELISMPLGTVLYESGDSLSYVYFPTSSIVSLLYVMENGSAAEIAVVGNEGIVGVAVFMGGESTTNRAIVQSSGHAYRLTSRLLMEEFRQHTGFMLLMLRYTQALITIFRRIEMYSLNRPDPMKQQDQYNIKNFRKYLMQDDVIWEYYMKSVMEKGKLTFDQFIEENIIDIHKQN